MSDGLTFYGTPNSGSRCVFDPFVCFWDSSSYWAKSGHAKGRHDTVPDSGADTAVHEPQYVLILARCKAFLYLLHYAPAKCVPSAKDINSMIIRNSTSLGGKDVSKISAKHCDLQDSPRGFGKEL